MTETRAELEAQARLLGIPTRGRKAELAAAISTRLAAAAKMLEAQATRAETRAQAVDDDELWVDTWHGRPNYHCRRCRFASLSKRGAKIHIAEQHPGGRP